MASTQDCEKALQALADRLAQSDDSTADRYERTLSCDISDLDVMFVGRLHNGRLVDIAQRDGAPPAQIRLTVSSDDLVALVDGSLSTGAALAAGRLKVKAGFRDLLTLRSIF